MFFRVIMKAEIAGVGFPSYCKSLSFLGPVVRLCTSFVPLARISYRTINGLLVYEIRRDQCKTSWPEVDDRICT